MILYCLHDTKALTWSYPQTTHNENTAVREYELLCKRPDFPSGDIELVVVGLFEPESGKVFPVKSHEVLRKGAKHGK